MNKYQKAINYLYTKMENGLIEDDEQQEVYEMAIDTLEKQIPRQVIDNKNNTCPVCGDFNSRIYNKYYCGKCGQKLKWD